MNKLIWKWNKTQKLTGLSVYTYVSLSTNFLRHDLEKKKIRKGYIMEH